jgi:hypothetical protein
MPLIKKLFSVLVFSAGLLGINTSFAQENDFQTWTNIGIQKKITDKLKFSLSEELRLCENSSRMKTLYSDAGLTYTLNKTFRIGGFYRLITSYDPAESYTNSQRVYTDISARHEFKRIMVVFRTRFQARVLNADRDPGNNPTTYNRNKLTLNYNIRHSSLSPFLGAEMFYQLNNGEGNKIDKLRFSAGTEYEINKKQNLVVYYMLQQEVNAIDPVRAFIFGLQYTYNLK